MKVNCDKCKKDFEMDIKTEIVKGDIERTYFICPYCNKKYISFYTNSKIRKKQQEIRKVTMCFDITNDIGKRMQLQAKFNKLNKEIGEDMKKLKTRFSKEL